MKRFKFVYEFCEGEPPDSVYLVANNITNAKSDWEFKKKPDEKLIAIFEQGKGGKDKLLWKDQETRYDDQFLDGVR